MILFNRQKDRHEKGNAMTKYIACSSGSEDVRWFDTCAEAIKYAKDECYVGDPFEIFECKLMGTVAIPEPDPEFFPCDD